MVVAPAFWSAGALSRFRKGEVLSWGRGVFNTENVTETAPQGRRTPNAGAQFAGDCPKHPIVVKRPLIAISMPPQNEPMIHALGLGIVQRWQVGHRG